MQSYAGAPNPSPRRRNIAAMAADSSGPSVSTRIMLPKAPAKSMTATMLRALALRRPQVSATLQRNREAS